MQSPQSGANRSNLTRDPLLAFLYSRPAFDTERDVALFEHLVEKYTSVAKAIVHELQEEHPNFPPPMKEDFFSINFDAFAFKEKKQCAVEQILQSFEEFDLFSTLKLNPNTLRNWIEYLSQQYLPVRYHNFLHAVDVTQFCCFLLKQGELHTELDPMGIGTLLLSALGHDLAHPGIGSPFTGALQNTEGIEVYGDTLEECHLKLFLQSVNDPRHRICKQWTDSQKVEFHELAASAIAATDMNNHLVALAHFDKMVENANEASAFPRAKRRFLMQLAIKCADISNVVRPYPVATEWSEALTQESAEGKRPNSAKASPVAFVDFIAIPLFAALATALPGTRPALWHLSHNRAQWTQQAQGR